eukprot:scaffold58163_cov39-Cyclotella_meneghiniana.AAC.1
MDHGVAQGAKSGFYSLIADLPIRFISLILRLSHIGIFCIDPITADPTADQLQLNQIPEIH